MKPPIQIFVCGGPGEDLEAGWHQTMAELCAQVAIDRDREMDLDDAAEFQHREAEFTDMREDVDPYWHAVTGTDCWYEEAKPDLALVYADE